MRRPKRTGSRSDATGPRPKGRRTEQIGGPERLQKVLAEAGVASRRAAETLILDGRVSVNGRVVRELGSRADPRRDRIQVDGKRIGARRQPRVYVVYKPRGVVSTTRDPQERRTVLDLVPSRERLYPVGRLDAQSEGLLLLTNDGALAHALLHPSFEVPRTYRVSVQGALRAPELRDLTRGVEIEGGTATMEDVRLLDQDEEGSRIEVVLREGRKRQIREMLRAVGHPVRRLVRVRFGPVSLSGLSAGEWRPLRPAERAALDRMLTQAQGGGSRSSKSAMSKRSKKT